MRALFSDYIKSRSHGRAIIQNRHLKDSIILVISVYTWTEDVGVNCIQLRSLSRSSNPEMAEFLSAKLYSLMQKSSSDVIHLKPPLAHFYNN